MGWRIFGSEFEGQVFIGGQIVEDVEDVFWVEADLDGFAGHGEWNGFLQEFLLVAIDQVQGSQLGKDEIDPEAFVFDHGQEWFEFVAEFADVDGCGGE